MASIEDDERKDVIVVWKGSVVRTDVMHGTNHSFSIARRDAVIEHFDHHVFAVVTGYG